MVHGRDALLHSLDLHERVDDVKSSLKLRLLNDSKPIDSGLWEWSVWVDGPGEELDRVKEVRYTLHPTFPNPVRTVTDRQSNFRLQSSGWGEFSILAQLMVSDGSAESLERWLRLEGRQEEAGDATRRRPRVYLSGSSIDRGFLRTIGAELEKQDVEVVTADDIAAESSFAESVTNAVSSSDVVAVLLSRGITNAAQYDIALARAGRKVVVPILLGKEVSPPALADLKAIHVATEDQSSQVADVLASRAKDAFFA